MPIDPTGPHYTLPEVCKLLRCSRRAFITNYQPLLTDMRPKHLRLSGSPRVFSRDEVNLALSDGWDAVADFRRRMGRQPQPGGRL
jgi:hypothetical protein